MIARGRRGAALAWAVVTLAVVTLACALIADGLARRARIVRHELERAAADDLLRAGRAIAKKGSDPFFAVELAGGTVRLEPVDERHVAVVVVPRISGRERREIVERRGR